MKILVLGAGMVGSAMALDMATKYNVTSADLNSKSLEKITEKNNLIQIQQLNVTSKTDLIKALQPFDLIISAVPGFLGYETLKTIIESKKNVVDISFFPEDGLQLNDLARKHGVTAIIDCGVAPGVDNLILGYHDSQMEVTDFECLVGGLPKVKKWPFCYKAPFSPVDVIEEYTRPARYVENSTLVTKPALTDCEYVEIENVGTLESFNSDGLRSIIQTMEHIPNMKEKTLRYPGHVEYIKVLKESGFFDKDAIDVNGMKVSPFDFTSQVLFKEWKLEDSELEMTVMRVRIKGINSFGVKEEVTYNLYDEFDVESGISSMSRTTGYTATAAANMLLDGLFQEEGVFPPELVGRREACFNYIMKYLNDRGVIYRKESVME
jgi:lysine 6-dehydrogenase